MKDRFFILEIFEASSLQLATVRSLLNAQKLFYIEIENTFVVSCQTRDAKPLATALTNDGINFLLVYINNKPGAAVFSNGINSEDQDHIEDIVTNN